jgi:uncharacterized iron-regulated protein
MRFIFVICVLFSCLAAASSQNKLIDGHTLQSVEIDQALSEVIPGTILIVSEVHDFLPHHKNQVTILQALKTKLNHISTAFEFFENRFQNAVDQYVDGMLTEDIFLKAVNWGRIPFDFYRKQVLFPKLAGGKTIALNAASTLTSKISKAGLESLTDVEKAELHEGFALGNELYFDRFKEVMQNHVTPDQLTHYFQAQSVWDDTMAYNAVQFISENPLQVLVVIVGDFHAQYGGGLPDRLKARGQKNLVVISQLNADGLSPDEINLETAPTNKYGPRSDFIFVSTSN